MKKLLTVLLSLTFLVSLLNAQSTFDKVLYQFEAEANDGYGIHGVAVDPNDNVWIALFGDIAGDTLFTTEGDTLAMRPIYVVDPNTGDHVSFSPIRFLEWADGTVDTLVNSARGIEVDNDGNLLIVGLMGSNTVVRMDYTTGKPLGMWTAPNTGSFTEAVQSPADGKIYVTHVVPGGKPLYMLDKDLNFITNAVDTVRQINRTLEISADGKELYYGSTWNGSGIHHYHSDVPGLTPFEMVDTIGNWFNVEGVDTTYDVINLWASSLDMGPDGVLYAGMLKDSYSNGHGKGSLWYGFDVTTGELVNTIGMAYDTSKTETENRAAGTSLSPRGAAWSNDGSKMYLADFDNNNILVWNYEEVVSVKELSSELPVKYELSQNYPNPFNPSTSIQFQLPASSDVTLKVFNVLGQEVATLVNEKMGAGSYEYNFDASNLSSGVYVYSLTAGDFHIAKKMTLMK